MSAVELDHLVVAASTLEEGVRWCEQTFGVTPGPGGRHPLMGTHNRLLPLGGACPQAYLEIIAIDPDAAVPTHPRWFGLDERDPAAPPSLVHWVARCGDLDARCAALAALGLDPGTPAAASRPTPHGVLAWTISVRADGRPQCGGALPTLIAWRGEHPTLRMGEPVLFIERVEAGGLPPAAAALLAAPGVHHRGAAGLRVTLRGPRTSGLGSVTLET